MGYYTNYTMTIEKSHLCETDDQYKKELEEVLKEHSDYWDMPWSEIVKDRTDQTKWYDHNDDMIALSKKYPALLIVLEGEGEESGDLWKAYYVGGKSQYCKAKITFDELEIGKLR